MSTRPNDYAYPHTYSDDGVSIAASGLTKREYFAAMAMQGFCMGGGKIKEIIEGSVFFADELIKELNKTA